VLRRIVSRKRDEMIKDRRKLRIKDLHNSYYLPKIIRVVKTRDETDRACKECMFSFCGKAGRNTMT
jgi:hypothetical protein